MSLVLGIDVETTGLDNKTDHIIEFAAVLWDWEKKKPLKIINEIIEPWDEDPHGSRLLDPFITKLTGISDEDILWHGIPLKGVLERVKELVPLSSCFVAHNAEFDRGFLLPHDSMFDGKWVDTMIDLPLDEDIHTSKKLTHLATSHGFLNPFSHRALFDVLTMLKIASEYDFETVKMRNMSPNVKLIAQVSFEEKELAKQAGFKWDAPNKQWFKKMKEVDYQKHPTYPFKYTLVEENGEWRQ